MGKKKKDKAEFPASFGVLDATWKEDGGLLTVHVFNHGNPEQLIYRGVPREVYEELKTAQSKGGYFNRNIRNSFEFVG